MIIPGFESREFWMSVFVLLITIISSIGFYWSWKIEQGLKPNLYSIIGYGFTGFISAIVLLSITNGGENYTHWNMALSAVMFGVASEVIVAKIRKIAENKFGDK